MMQVTRSLGLIGWLLLATPLVAQNLPQTPPPRQQQTQYYANNPKSTGPVTDGANIPPRGEVNPRINPPLRSNNWPPSTPGSPAAIRNLPHNKAAGQPTQNTYQRGVVPRDGVPRGAVPRGAAPQGAIPRQATLPQHMQQRPPRAPFQLTDAQQADVNQVLELWEKESSKIQTFKCSFTKFDYDPVFGPATKEKTRSKGRISYVKPDKGKFEITQMLEYNSQTLSYEEVPGGMFDHWVCTGDAVYQVKKSDKTIVKQEIPLERRGQAISDGPLPFLFGAKAEKLRQRYWIRITQSTPTEIWLEVFPRWQADAASYSRVELILGRKEYLPLAILLHSPGGKNRESYTFATPSVNNLIDRAMPFTKPITYPGWTLKDETPRPQAPGAQPATQQTPIATTPYQRQ